MQDYTYWRRMRQATHPNSCDFTKGRIYRIDNNGNTYDDKGVRRKPSVGMVGYWVESNERNWLAQPPLPVPGMKWIQPLEEQGEYDEEIPYNFEEKKMAQLEITVETLIDGNRSSTYEADRLVKMIQAQRKAADDLLATGVKSKWIDQEVAKYTRSITTLTALLDARTVA